MNSEPALASYVNIVEQSTFLPSTNPAEIGFIATIAFMIFSLIASTREEDFRSNQGSQPIRRNDDEDQQQSISVDYAANLEDNNLKGPIDSLRYGRFLITRRLDATRFSVSHYSAHYSPLLSRLASDGSWLQAIIGPLIVLLPAISVFVGASLAIDTDMTSSLIPSSITLVMVAVIIGVLDAASGAVIAFTYGFVALISQNIVNAIDLRAIIGLSLIFFAPVLLAGTIRPLRREREDWSPIERITDIAVAGLFSAIAVQGIFKALDAVSQQETLLASYGKQFSVIIGVAIALRFLLEDVAVRLAPARLNYLVPTKRIPQESSFFVASLILRVAIFILFLHGFFGFSWQIFAGLLLFVIPQLLKSINSRFPNLPSLYQLLPSGLPQIVIMGFVGAALSAWVNSLPIIASDRSKTILVVLGVPGLLLAILKSFGREPAAGDVKWYCRKNFRLIYYMGGVLMLMLAYSQATGVFI
jgi:hypothetical protein